MRKITEFFAWFILLCIIMPITAESVVAYSRGWPANWKVADWSSSGVLPKPDEQKPATVIILASRTGRWKSVFADHMSLVFKAENASAWTRYDVVGWGKPVRQDAYVADAFWYGNIPRVIYKLEGEAAAKLIPAIENSIHAYPNAAEGSYVIWPGPNSNTFVSWVVRHTDGFDAELSSAAVGKDYLGPGAQMARAPSDTGYTVSYGGYIGSTLAWEEGAELHLLGSTIGVDLNDLAIKLPALGKLSLFDLVKN
jgi:Protein of unknown function (DUF3750)